MPNIPGKVHAVIGMRRAGKTTFLLQLHAQRIAVQPPERTIYLSFDDDRLADLPLEQLDLLPEEYYRRYPSVRQNDTVTLMLDEIHNVRGWERFIRRILDTERVEIIVSGSSAKLLSREIHTSLRGSVMETIIRPFSFREFLRFRSAEPTRPADRLASVDRSQMEWLFQTFLQEGGFPEVQEKPRDGRLQLLQGYVDTVLFRDVVERHAIRQSEALRLLIRQLPGVPGGAFSVHRFHNDLRSQGRGVLKDVLYEMIGHLEDAFLIRSLYIDTESDRRRNSNPRRVYPVDQGMIEAFDRSARPNTGHALKTAVLHELDRRGGDIRYVKTVDGLEVDFLARLLEGTEELIQICTDPSDPQTCARELRALEAAAQQHPQALRRILVANHSGMPADIPDNVAIEPAWVWLLRAPVSSRAMQPAPPAHRSKSRARHVERPAPGGRCDHQPCSAGSPYTPTWMYGAQ